MSKQAEDQAETAHYAKWIFWVVTLHVVFTIISAISVNYASGFCVEQGYARYHEGHCIRTVNGTDEVVPLEELRDE